jgi:hypothetical protein
VNASGKGKKPVHTAYSLGSSFVHNTGIRGKAGGLKGENIYEELRARHYPVPSSLLGLVEGGIRGPDQLFIFLHGILIS